MFLQACENSINTGLPLASPQSEGRTSHRLDLNLSTDLTFPSGREIKVRLKSLHKGGFIAETSEWLRVSDLKVALPALGTMAAEVLWQVGGRFGASFHKELAPGQFLSAALTSFELSRTA